MIVGQVPTIVHQRIKWHNWTQKWYKCSIINWQHYPTFTVTFFNSSCYTPRFIRLFYAFGGFGSGL